MAKFVWSGAQDGNWFNPNNWNPAIVPGVGAQVFIPAGLTNYPVIGDTRAVTLNQNLFVGGTLTLNSTGDNTDLILNGGANLKLSGGGSLLLSDNHANRIYSNQSGTVLENVDDTIAGAGQIFSNSAMSIINDAAGVIDASAVNNALAVTNILINNSGLVEATGAGGLALTSVSLVQASGGTLKANGGNVYLNSTEVAGGSVQTTGGGLVETTGGVVTLDGLDSPAVTITAGSTVQVNDATNLTLIGAVNDRGTILLNSGQDGIHFDNTDFIVNGATTDKLQGGGVLQLSDSAANRIYSNQGGTTLENVDDTITGAGKIFSNGALSILNDAAGVINASATNNALAVNNILITNNGLVEATGAGGLALTSVTLDQSGGGTLNANGGNVYLNSMSVLGGTLVDSGSGLIQTTGGAVTLNGTSAHVPTIAASSTVRVNDSTNLTLVGVINDQGQIFVDSGQDGIHFDNTDIVVNGGATTTLEGGGVVQLSDSGANRIFSNQAGTVLENVDDTITGAGQIFANSSLSILNDAGGVINASAAQNRLNINAITVTNNGLVEATGTAGLALTSMTLNQSGGGVLSANGGNVYLSGSALVGGSLSTSGGGLIETTGGGTTLNGSSSTVTVNAGSTLQVNDASNLTLLGVINNKGTIFVDSGQDGVHFDNTDLVINGGGTVTLQGGGLVQLSNSGANRIYSNQPGTTLENVDDSISGAGQIYANSNLTLKNDASGTINASSASSTLSINSITVNNAGLIESTAAGGLQLSSMTLNNTGTLKAAGGNVYLNGATIAGGTLSTTGSSQIITNGAGSVFNGVANAVNVASGATISIADATNLSITGTINNVGNINLNSGQDGAHFDNTDLLVQGGGGTVTLTGGGAIQLVTGGNNRIFSTQANTVLDNINDKIQGSGQIFANSSLSIVNETSGVINASNTGQTLSITSIGITNKGLLTSRSDGLMTLNSMTLTQSGAGQLAATQGNIYANGSHIIGGAISSAGGYAVATNGVGTLLDGSSATLSIVSGSTVLVSDATNLSLTGSISNSGTILVDSGEDGVHFDNTDLLINGAANLTGGGAVLLSNSANNRIFSNTANSVLTNTNDTIIGGGQIFSNGALSIVNAAGGTIEAGPGQSLSINLNLSNAGVLEGNGGSLNVQGPVTGTGTAMVANLGSVTFHGGASLGSLVYAGPNSGVIAIPATTTPTVSGFADGDTLEVLSNATVTTFQFNENTGNASGVLTFYNGSTAVESFTFNGYYTTQDFQLITGGGLYGVAGVGDFWTGGTDVWNTQADWSQGVPGADDDVVINGGAPTINASIGTIRSLVVGSIVDFAGATGNTVTGAIYDSATGHISLDFNAGEGGASLTAGSVDVVSGGLLSLGNATLSADDLMTVGAITNAGAITLVGSATKQALVSDTGAAGFGAAGVVTGNVSLAGDSAIKFASGGLQKIATGSALTLNGTAAFVEISGRLNANSALTTLTNISGTLSLENGATVAPTAALYDVGAFNIDDLAGAGGSVVTLPTLYVTGSLTIGNSAMTVADQVNVTTFRSIGTVTLVGGATAQALLNVTAGAAFDNPAGRLFGSVSLSGVSAIKFASGALTSIAAGASLREQGAKAFVEVASSLNSNSALTTLSLVAGALSLENGATMADSVSMTDSGSVSLDSVLGEGGSSLSLKGLNVTGSLSIGNVNLSKATTVTTTSLSSTGSITISGAAGFQSLLNVGAAAGFGTLGVLTGAVNLSGNSAIEFSFGSITTIAGSSSLRLAGGSAFLEIVGQLGSNSALKSLATVNGSLSLDTNETVATTAALGNAGSIAIDAVGGEGGSQLTTPLGLTNSGALTLGNSTLASADLVKAKSLANTGAINVIGGASTQALVNIGSAAGFGTAGQVSGAVSLAGDSAIEFVGGSITTIAVGSSLTLNGASAFIENAAGLNQNSALTTLSFDSGVVSLHNSVTLASAKGLSVAALAQLVIDNNAGEGGSNVTFAGALGNSGFVTVGNASLSQNDLLQATSLSNAGSISLTGGSATQALLNITGAAAFGGGGNVTGNVSLLGDTAIEFASGALTGVAAGASLILNGPNAYIEDASALNANSALSGLSNILGAFDLFNGGSVTSASQIVNSGQIEVWVNGGSGLNTTLTTTQALKNSGSLSLQVSGAQQANVTVSAASLMNSGSISLDNQSNNPNNLTLLNIGGAAGFGAAGVLSGTVYVGTQSAVEFASGSINQISKGSSLELHAATSFLENAGGLSSNSALTTLSTIAGVLQLDAASTVSTTAAVTNSGTLSLLGAGGSFATAAKLTNTGTGTINIGGSFAATQTISISAASLANSGAINIASNGAQASLTLGAPAGFGATGVLSGAVSLAGNAVISFASGSITSVSGGSLLHMNGVQTGIAAGGGSALSSLGGVAGVLDLDNGASIADSATLAISGGVFLDSFANEGASSLSDSVAINVAATGTLNVGNTSAGASSAVTTASLTNSGSINLLGNGSNHFGQLGVTGAMTNNGEVFVISDLETLAGSVGGTGTFDIWNNSTLNFSNAVGAGQTVTFDNSGVLGVNASGNVFKATIAGFGAGDSIQMSNFAGSGANWSFAENNANTGGVLTLTNGSSSAQLTFAGIYSTNSFNVTGSASTAAIGFV